MPQLLIWDPKPNKPWSLLYILPVCNLNGKSQTWRQMSNIWTGLDNNKRKYLPSHNCLLCSRPMHFQLFPPIGCFWFFTLQILIPLTVMANVLNVQWWGRFYFFTLRLVYDLQHILSLVSGLGINHWGIVFKLMSSNLEGRQSVCLQWDLGLWVGLGQ